MSDDIAEQLVFVRQNIAKMKEIENSVKTASARGIKTRESCIRSKLTALRILNVAMHSELSNEGISLDRVLRLRQINNNFMKMISEIKLCESE